jgi:hypothetical protein
MLQEEHTPLSALPDNILSGRVSSPDSVAIPDSVVIPVASHPIIRPRVIIKTVAELANAPRYSDGTYKLMNANLTYAQLRGANLRGANLCGADLSNADLRDADLTDALLRGAILTRTDISSAFIGGADFQNANASSSIGVPLTIDICYTEFDESDLPDMAVRMGLKIMKHTCGRLSLTHM